MNSHQIDFEVSVEEDQIDVSNEEIDSFFFNSDTEPDFEVVRVTGSVVPEPPPDDLLDGLEGGSSTGNEPNLNVGDSSHGSGSVNEQNNDNNDDNDNSCNDDNNGVCSQ